MIKVRGMKKVVGLPVAAAMLLILASCGDREHTPARTSATIYQPDGTKLQSFFVGLRPDPYYAKTKAFLTRGKRGCQPKKPSLSSRIAESFGLVAHAQGTCTGCYIRIVSNPCPGDVRITITAPAKAAVPAALVKTTWDKLVSVNIVAVLLSTAAPTVAPAVTREQVKGIGE